MPFSVECKRSARGAIMTSWLVQAKRQGAAEKKPWLLVVAGHNDRRPTVTLELAEFVAMAREAGRIP